jgi:hypothetical protein
MARVFSLLPLAGVFCAHMSDVIELTSGSRDHRRCDERSGVGSTGTGNFSDYPGSRREPAEEQTGGGGSGSGSGSGSEGGGDPCLTPLPEVRLEEVERCPFYTTVGDVPPPGTDVEVLPDLVGGRLAVATQGGRQVVGFLPTRLNHLLGCLNSGYSYPGEVTASALAPVAVVQVQLAPTS